ncbi:MAG: CoA transferase [Firmicutes bacterium]|nr:CoA transferase [Bacillota bacterium]
MEGPLKGVRVLDLTRLLPGPFATLLLNRLGADVLKVEDPKHGDYLRELAPDSFEVLNAGKTSISIDLKQSEGRDFFLRLVERADVLIESFRPGVASRLSIDYQSLKPRNPALIYASLSGYGQTGPLCDWPGHDLNYLGLIGGLDFSEETVLPNPLPVADESSGILMALTIASLLFRRRSSGEGAYVDLSMSDAAAFFALPMRAQQILHPQQHEVLGTLPGYGTYLCADGLWMSVGAIEDKFWRGLCESLDHPEWVEQYPSAFIRSKNSKWLDNQLREMLLQRRREEWLALLVRNDVPVAPVHPPREAISDSQIQARCLIKAQADRVLFYFPALVSTWVPQEPARAPELGEQTEELLSQMGVSKERLKQLEAAGIVRSASPSTSAMKGDDSVG